MKIALIGAGGKMGLRIADKLKRSDEYTVVYVQRDGPGLERLKKSGLEATPMVEALADSAVAILAVPDAKISTLAIEIVQMLPSGGIIICLDPAAAYGNVIPLRDDLTYLIAHPCHPPIFNDEVSKEAQGDHFGGIYAKQHIVCALYHGKEEHYQIGEKIARAMYAPVMNSFRISVEQMAILEPALVETTGVTVLVALREALEKAIKMGVPEDAAKAFLFGHLQIAIAQVFEFVKYPMSEGAQLAVRNAYEKIFRPGWLDSVMNLDRISESVAEITGNRQ